jgi:hypothetical protein
VENFHKRVARLRARRASILEEKLGPIKVYTDQNVDVRVAEGLRRRGIEAVSVYRPLRVNLQRRLACSTILTTPFFIHVIVYAAPAA